MDLSGKNYANACPHRCNVQDEESALLSLASEAAASQTFGVQNVSVVDPPSETQLVQEDSPVDVDFEDQPILS